MKKLAGFLLAATLVFSMTTVAFAAGSKSTTVSDGTVDTAAGKVTITHTIDAKETAAAGITTDSKTGKSTIADASLASVKTALNAESINVLDVFDVEAPANYQEGTAVDVTIPGVTYQDGIQVLHFQDGKWVALPTKKGANNTVVATFTKFSPTAIALVTKAQASTKPADTTAADKTATTKTDAKKAPKTGESNTVLYVTLLALVAGASAVAAKRKFA